MVSRLFMFLMFSVFWLIVGGCDVGSVGVVLGGVGGCVVFCSRCEICFGFILFSVSVISSLLCVFRWNCVGMLVRLVLGIVSCLSLCFSMV